MARTKHETDELALALMKWADADPNAALVVAAIKDGTGESGSLITLGHAGCTVASVLVTVAELLDLAEEQILAGSQVNKASRSLERIRAGRIALGLLGRETVQ